MRIVIAPQSLKGSLSAAETGAAIAQGAQAVYPEAEIVVVPVADGGEGTVQALVDATGGSILTRRVTGPLGEPVEAFFGLLGGEDRKTAVIEMAACAGLPLISPEQRNPRITTTYGVGELIRAALDEGCRHFLLGIGGSATNDGGAGLAQALGIHLLATNGQELTWGGAALAQLAQIDSSNLDSRLVDCTFEVACDVTNPLCGASGASAIYGPQKGATPEMVAELDAALAHYAQIIDQDLGISIAEQPGAGAAGGLGAGLLAFLNATLRPGAAIVLEAVNLERHLEGADLVITAEGQLDEQTAYGKSVGAVAALAKQRDIPVLALAGGLSEGYQGIYQLGIDAVAVLPSRPMSLVYAIHNAATLTRDATERALRILKLGMSMTNRIV
ncbi:glycerate kinase [Tengunoibacter tsumagoiensis]|uniref:Glycerate kinase n=1 Tax=Tengunoibacter tsumagoiensis TaxID=2014871 RepID=A0A402A1Z2_9CHLR|nr:glycerate kinase [Tengunoibacter tsumagoiensis]GCE13075.1 glycerate kinase [Tengunoibacter tsumagoiensis]